MKHPEKCETAKHSRCRCGWCGGALHGWPGFQRLAERPPEARSEYRATVDDEWFGALRAHGDPEGRPKTMKRAAAKRATADLVDLLAGDQGFLRQVKGLGDHLSGPVRKTAIDLAGKQPVRDRDDTDPQRRTLGHFWCSLLVELSGAVDRIGDAAEASAESAAALQEPLPDEAHPFASDLQKELAVLTLRSLMISQMLHDPLLIMRIMAVFMCPDPANHPQIAKQCLFPLVDEAIGDDAAASLRRAFGDPEAE